MTQSVIPFRLDRKEAQDGGSLDYRPWGTRSLKIRVKTDKDLKKMRLRLKNVETKPGLVRAYADDSQELLVSWGGGHEKNQPASTKDVVAFEKPIPLKAGKTNYVYFNLAHVGPGLPDDARLTVEAYPLDSGETEATLSLCLQTPASYSDDVMRLVPAAGEPDCWVVSPGQYLPKYESRWWPSAQVLYEPTSVPALFVKRDGNQLQVHWPDQAEPIAVITDQTTPSILDQSNRNVAFELFQFVDPRHDYLALRLWFFWFDTSITQFALGGVGRHEVPDSERFDLLIRRQDGQAVLACTDLHWREVWGQVVEPPLQATIGLNGQQKVELAGKTLWRYISQKKDNRRNYNPLNYIERLAERLAEEDEVKRAITIRAKGTQAHAPSLNNVQQVQVNGNRKEYTYSKGTRTNHDMTSSDVRLV